jgi:hypothetical protein
VGGGVVSEQERSQVADKQERQIKPFVEWLEKHKKGEVDTELTHELRELISAVQDTGKAGVLTLKLTVKRKSDHQVTVLEDITVKTPVHDRAEAIYFLDQNLNLLRSDPRQGVLTPFKQRTGTEGDDE